MIDKKLKQKLLLEKISDIFIFVYILIFPLLINSKGYFDILGFKWSAYVIITITYLLCNVSIFLYYLLRYRINFFKGIHISKTIKIIMILLFIMYISYFLSPFREHYNLILGEGRYEGLFINTLYLLMFLNICAFSKFKKRYILYFLISSILVNSITVMQYFGLNPLGLYKHNHNISFMTTFGNVDTVSAFSCITFPISLFSYIYIKDNKYKNLSIISLIISIMSVIIIDVKGGKLAIICMLIILLPILILKSENLSKLLTVLSITLFDYLIYNSFFPKYNDSITNITYTFNLGLDKILAVIIVIVLLYLSKRVKKLEFDYFNKNNIKKLYIGIFVLFLTFIIVLFIFDFNFSFLHDIHKILHFDFDDKLGSYRIFLWKRTLKLVTDYPIIGTGLDSFVIRFMNSYTKDLIDAGIPSINDTAANVYLTMLINLGFTGLITYLLYIFEQIKNGLKFENIYSKILLTAFICFVIQDFFNFSVVIVTPIFWTMGAIFYKSAH